MVAGPDRARELRSGIVSEGRREVVRIGQRIGQLRQPRNKADRAPRLRSPGVCSGRKKRLMAQLYRLPMTYSRNTIPTVYNINEI